MSFNLIASIKALSPNKVTFWGPGGQNFKIYISLGHISIHNTTTPDTEKF